MLMIPFLGKLNIYICMPPMCTEPMYIFLFVVYINRVCIEIYTCTCIYLFTVRRWHVGYVSHY